MWKCVNCTATVLPRVLSITYVQFWVLGYFDGKFILSMTPMGVRKRTSHTVKKLSPYNCNTHELATENQDGKYILWLNRTRTYLSHMRGGSHDRVQSCPFETLRSSSL